MPAQSAGTIRPRRKGRQERDLNTNRPQPTAPINIISAVKATNVITITFDKPVFLKGIPAYTTNLAGVTALSATSPSPMTVAVTFSASIAAATTLNIPYEEPAVRNGSGGFVANSTFPLT